MRDDLRLPPLLRVARIVGFLFPLGGLALIAASYFMGLSVFPYSVRVAVIAFNLISLGWPGTVVAQAYRTHGRRPVLGLFPLALWQGQVRAFLLLWALPLCGIVSAFVIAPTSPAFTIVFLLTMLAAIFVTLVALPAVSLSAARTGSMRTLPNGSAG